MSRPKISLHKIDLSWKTEKEKEKVKRTQRDYTMSFKLGTVSRIESEFPYRQAQKNYAIHREVLLFWSG